jgi:hypothetical protein
LIRGGEKVGEGTPGHSFHAFRLAPSVAYRVMIAIALTDMGAIEPAGVAARIVAAAEGEDKRI